MHMFDDVVSAGIEKTWHNGDEMVITLYIWDVRELLLAHHRIVCVRVCVCVRDTIGKSKELYRFEHAAIQMECKVTEPHPILPSVYIRSYVYRGLK